ncbi:hypothetical protein DERP_014543 [Dermatophagoides pteronyssinus]|uniref:Uncharacterized protein n=1 Tax=Dermatophagoides pteronyssinus TaxID=6956 RepID=A0ABQ8J1Q2_DERPT|nr:hypothetical protein DERP_014543 [Dermatophagoides pteronyssinus]
MLLQLLIDHVLFATPEMESGNIDFCCYQQFGYTTILGPFKNHYQHFIIHSGIRPILPTRPRWLLYCCCCSCTRILGAGSWRAASARAAGGFLLTSTLSICG